MMVYVVQQMSQFQLMGKDFAKQHLGVNKEMHLALREVLKKLPLEDRLSTVEDLPAEVRLRGLPTEERLKGLPAEEILRGLTPEELDRLRKLLQQPTVANSGGE